MNKKDNKIHALREHVKNYFSGCMKGFVFSVMLHQAIYNLTPFFDLLPTRFKINATFSTMFLYTHKYICLHAFGGMSVLMFFLNIFFSQNSDLQVRNIR